MSEYTIQMSTSDSYTELRRRFPRSGIESRSHRTSLASIMCLQCPRSESFGFNQRALNNLPKAVAFESTRIVNHMLAIGCHLADAGAVSFILWLLTSERNFQFFERQSGIRLHSRVSTVTGTVLIPQRSEQTYTDECSQRFQTSIQFQH